MPTGGRVVQPHVATSVADESVDSDSYVDGSIDLVHMSAESVDSDQYVDGSIDEAHIANDQVTLAKMAGLARGKIIYGDASGDPAALAIGSDNYVLTVDGSDIGWEAAASAGISTTLADGNILVGNVSNVATSVNPSGDVDVTNAGVFSIASGVVVDADVNGSAAISISKTALVAGTNITLSTNTLAVDDAFLKNDANDTTTGIITAGGLTLSEAGNVSIGTPLLPSTDHTYSGMSAEMLAGGTIGAQYLAVPTPVVSLATTPAELTRLEIETVAP